MKLFAILAAVAIAEKGRPETIDASKRLAKLEGLVDGCLADSFFDGPKKKRLVRKLAKLHSIARNYVTKAGNRNIEADEDDDARINANDPCSCLGGAAGGYKSFFNRLAAANGFENEQDFVGGYRRGEARKIQGKLIDNNLNAHYGCNLPNKD